MIKRVVIREMAVDTDDFAMESREAPVGMMLFHDMTAAAIIRSGSFFKYTGWAEHYKEE